VIEVARKTIRLAMTIRYHTVAIRNLVSRLSLQILVACSCQPPSIHLRTASEVAHHKWWSVTEVMRFSAVRTSASEVDTARGVIPYCELEIASLSK